MKFLLFSIFTVFVSVGSGIKPIPPYKAVDPPRYRAVDPPAYLAVDPPSYLAVDPPVDTDILVDPTLASTTKPEVSTVPYYECCCDCIHGPRPTKAPRYSIACKLSCPPKKPVTPSPPLPPSPTEQPCPRSTLPSDTGTLFV